ncbi:MAG: 23S rRNA (adenine(1618)-N(6))-methyltransferase RlmF [Flavobacteriales bacterium]|nr:23S rRNA (adenine(1618)-N(6))-methyltransferase RlmF [Flavobacteriales bacterium]
MTHKKVHPKEKLALHPRNKHRERYNFSLLVKTCPELKPFVLINKLNDESIDFFNPDAVKTLNQALLKHYYDIKFWDIPKDFLCPPIPGRADYIHYIADLLSKSHQSKIPTGNAVKILDIGVGANCVYPIIGNSEYGWSFVGAEINPLSLESAKTIVKQNSRLAKNVTLRLQTNPKELFNNIIQTGEKFDVSICNPPFHSSEIEAKEGTSRKLKNLKGTKTPKLVLNFGGQHNELWTEDGEIGFVKRMINESKQFGNSCCWFSTLISKESNLTAVYQELKNCNALETMTIPMQQGNKMSRIVAWAFLTSKERALFKSV